MNMIDAITLTAQLYPDSDYLAWVNGDRSVESAREMSVVLWGRYAVIGDPVIKLASIAVRWVARPDDYAIQEVLDLLARIS